MLIALGEIESELNAKKYGLVWEEHEEAVDVKMRTHIPVFTEDASKEITRDTGGMYNFILEGDNLHSLRLLEKTHAGKIDVIYIDPPYNTKNKDFVYDDKKIDATDGFQHSKWLSFMTARLRIAEKLLKSDGVLAISIGFHEVNNLMLICDEIFSTRQVVCVTVQTSSGNAVANGFTVVQEYVVFVTPNDFEPFEVEGDKKENANPYHGMNLSGFNQIQRPNQAYPIFIDKNGLVVGCGKTLQQRIDEGLYSGEKADFIYDYSEAPDGCTAVWPVTQGGDPCVWRLIPENFLQNWSKGYIKVVPNKKGKNKYTVQYLSGGIIEQIENGSLETRQNDSSKPSLDVIGFKTAASSISTVWTDNKFLTAAGSRDIKGIFNKKVAFSFPKPVALIREILMRVSDKNDIVLDFFAGSGTTAQAVLELNKDDDGHRKFILCTNNESNICTDITYPRVETVITGMRPDGSKYSDGIPANLKYYRTDFVSKDEEYLSDALLEHIAEMIQLEHGVKLDGENYIMILDDDEADNLAAHWSDYPDVKALYVSKNVLFTTEQNALFKDVEVHIIPDYYFNFELREVGETW
jgi:adenine-specific DNA-methyltransferase